ncbi:uncharacterized protein P884DRAFT_274330 [Thermothelomyces heterothallicus CBS 202.75]|uniref:uncharacterized protein n=1 Tax=Thermothelomyces heterothallicus CBS 202.75 TaxID=1149848 RepID=UPI003741FAC2
MAQELPDDAKYALGSMKAQIDQLQEAISQMREKNAEFEIRLRAEAQLRREMEMWWWADKFPKEHEKSAHIQTRSPALRGRIRINSPELLRICFQIQNELNPGHSRRYRNVQELKPKVMIQPFKTLVYNAERIRGCYRQLDENLKRSPDARATKGLDTQLEPGTEPKRHQDEHNIRNLAQPASERQDPVVAPSLFSSIEDERRARDHLRCLLEFIDGDLKERTEHIRGGNCSRVTFGELWLLFQPGDIVLWNSAPQVALVLGTVDPGHKATKPFRGRGLRRRDKKKEEGDEDDCFVIMCVSIEFDGVQLGPSSSMVKIPRFEGEKSIRSLPIYPLAYSSGPNAREAYIARGKKFLEMTKIRHMYYTGQTVDPTTTYVDSQVVIDVEEAFHQWPHWRPDIENLVGIDIETEVTGSTGRRPRVSTQS